VNKHSISVMEYRIIRINLIDIFFMVLFMLRATPAPTPKEQIQILRSGTDCIVY
jgi:hypothetical protein